MEVTLTNGLAAGPGGPAGDAGRSWPMIEAIPRRLSVHVSQRTLRRLAPVAIYLAFVLLMHAVTSVRPGVVAANDTYLCKRH